jgi:hypothetical protein
VVREAETGTMAQPSGILHPWEAPRTVTTPATRRTRKTAMNPVLVRMATPTIRG